MPLPRDLANNSPVAVASASLACWVQAVPASCTTSMRRRKRRGRKARAARRSQSRLPLNHQLPRQDRPARMASRTATRRMWTAAALARVARPASPARPGTTAKVQSVKVLQDSRRARPARLEPSAISTLSTSAFAIKPLVVRSCVIWVMKPRQLRHAPAVQSERVVSRCSLVPDSFATPGATSGDTAAVMGSTSSGSGLTMPKLIHIHELGPASVLVG